METPGTSVQKGRVRPRGDQIRFLREQKGWRIVDLAADVGCSEKTISNAEHGKTLYVFTLSQIAKSLGVKYKEIAEREPIDPAVKRRRDEFAAAFGDPPSDSDSWEEIPLPWPQPGRVKLSLIIDVESRKLIDEAEELYDLMQKLKRLLGAKDDITLDSIDDGSLILNIDVGESDVYNLVNAFCDGNLDDLKVSAIICPEYLETLFTADKFKNNPKFAHVHFRGDDFRMTFDRINPPPSFDGSNVWNF